MTLSHGALAQRLHFKNDQPEPGTGRVASALALEAREQFDALRAEGAASPASQAKQAYLAAAGVFLESGEGKGVGGTYLVAAGTAMMRDRDEVFGILDSKRLGEDETRLLASDLSQCVQSPPAGQIELDRRLRDAFANLMQSAASKSAVDPNLWPWPEIASAPAPVWPDCSRLGSEAAPLEELHKRCELAERWPAFRPGARTMTRLMMEAAWPIGHEKQIASGVYRRWMNELTRGAEEILSESGGEVGLARLRRLALLARALATLDALAPDPGARQLEKVLLTKVEVMPDDPDQSRNDGLARLEQWLTSASDRTALIDDKKVVRQLRPAVRSIAELARRTQSELFQALERVATDPDSAGDPGVIAAVNLFAENIALLKLLHRASAAVEDSGLVGSDPVARDNAQPFTDGLLKLAKEVADPRQRDRSLRALSNLASDVADLTKLPGEDRLRAADAELDAILGGQAAQVLALIDRERLAWRRGVGAVMKPGASSGGEASAAKLRALGIVLSLALDIAECRAAASTSGDALERWGGWWIDDAALSHYASEGAKALPAILKEVEEGESPVALARSATEPFAIAALAAELSRTLGEPGPDVGLEQIRAIATGTPDPGAVLLVSWREPLAVVCRYGVEGVSGNDDARVFATKRANEVLEAMKRTGSNQ